MTPGTGSGADAIIKRLRGLRDGLCCPSTGCSGSVHSDGCFKLTEDIDALENQIVESNEMVASLLSRLEGMRGDVAEAITLIAAAHSEVVKAVDGRGFGAQELAPVSNNLKDAVIRVVSVRAVLDVLGKKGE
jgi:hypothetical protein